MEQPGFLTRLKNSPALRAAQIVWVALVVFFLGWYFHKNWSQFTNYDWNIQWGWIGLAVALAATRRLLGGVRWVMIALFDQPWGRAGWSHLRVYFLSNVALYIPGNVWFVANRIYLSKNQGLTVLKSSLGMAYEILMSLWTGMVVGSYVGLAVLVDSKWTLAFLFAVFFGLSLVMFHQGTVNFFLARLYKILKREPARVEVPFWWMVRMMTVSFLVWITGGLSLVCVLHALAPAVPVNPAFATSALAIAWVIGFCTPWAPSGLGVQEGILAWFLRAWPTPVPVIATICLRLLYVTEDVFWLSVTLLFSRKKDHADEQPDP